MPESRQLLVLLGISSSRPLLAPSCGHFAGTKTCSRASRGGRERGDRGLHGSTSPCQGRRGRSTCHGETCRRFLCSKQWRHGCDTRRCMGHDHRFPLFLFFDLRVCVGFLAVRFSIGSFGTSSVGMFSSVLQIGLSPSEAFNLKSSVDP